MSGRQFAACLLLSLFCAVPLRAQFSVADLSQLRDYESHRTSSFDRSGGNGDYQNLKPAVNWCCSTRPGRRRSVISGSQWTDPEAYHLKKIVLRMYWDGEKTPSVEAPIGDFLG